MTPPRRASQLAVQQVAIAGQNRQAEMLASLQLAVVLGLLWLGLFAGQQLVFGSLAVVIVVVVCRQVVPLRPVRISWIGLCSFTAHFVVQSLAGALDVAYRALHPRGELEIGQWQYQVRLPAGQARFLFIACIGLIPGAVCQQLRDDELTIHSIAGDPQLGLAALEQHVAALYGFTLGSEAA